MWKKLTSDSFILNMVSGSEIPIENECLENVEISVRRNPVSKEESPMIDHEIERLIRMKVIEKSKSEAGEIISPIFSVPKPDGSVRIILNLKEFNEFVEYEHFKMENAVTAIQMMRRGCFMASIDLRSAYHSVPIKKEHRKYLKFIWRGQLFQYTCFPNGLSNCPRYFTKLMKPVYAFLRSQGHISTAYIDDSYLQAQTYNSCVKNIQDTLKLLESLGFVIHFGKSVMTPCHEITYLGFVFNSLNMTVRLTKEKAEKIINLCIELKKKNKTGQCSIRELAQVIGACVASFLAVLWGRLHYRQMEHAKTEALKRNQFNFEAQFKLTKEAEKEIDWWIDNVKNAYYPIELERSKPEIEIRTDASTSGGWGAVCGDLETGGRWNDNEKDLNINALELLAVEYGLKSFKSQVAGKHVKILTDNTCTVTYVKNMGGSKSMLCNSIANRIWCWCEEENVWLTIAHIPGKINVDADRKSRVFNDFTEWMLNHEIFLKIKEKLGTPEIDLFASRLNYQLKPFIAWSPDPEAFAIDAFTITWDMFAYAFPPFCLIQRVLAKLEEDQGDIILIAPVWTTAAWFPQVLQLLVAEPVLLPRGRGVLKLTHSEMLHPLHKTLQLMAVSISGQQLKQRAFTEKLATSSVHPGDYQHRNNTMGTLKNGSYFVRNGKLIHCVLL